VEVAIKFESLGRYDAGEDTWGQSPLETQTQGLVPWEKLW